MPQILPRHRVPRRHVLLHAVGIAGLLARGEGGAGFRDAALEAVLVEFLPELHVSGRGHGAMQKHKVIELWFMVCVPRQEHERCPGRLVGALDP